MNSLVSKVHAKEKRWRAEFAALRELCLGSGLNEELKWGQACYDLAGGNIVLIHGFKDYCALLFMKGALLKDPSGILVQKSGAKVVMKTAAQFDSPPEFQAQLDDEPELAEAFHALTPGRQKGYLLHFAGAKQAATRVARVKKHVPRILKGLGLDD